MLFESDFHAVGKITGDLLYKKYIYIYIYIYMDAPDFILLYLSIQDVHKNGRSRFHAEALFLHFILNICMHTAGTMLQ
jgi:hypothetical protein